MPMPSGLRIVFFGTPAFAAYILEYLKNEGENVVAVVTTPQKQQGRGLKTKPMVMQEAAQKLGIPVLAPEKLRDENAKSRQRYAAVLHRRFPPPVGLKPTQPTAVYPCHS